MRSLRQAAALLRGEEPPNEPPVAPLAAESRMAWRGDQRLIGLDLADVLGQPEARKSAEVAAAGGDGRAYPPTTGTTPATPRSGRGPSCASGLSAGLFVVHL